MLSASEIFGECVAQTSVDFTALRVGNPQSADAVYEDYVLSPDMRPEAMTEIESLKAAIDLQLSDYIGRSDFDGERIYYVFCVRNDRLPCAALKRLLQDWFKGGVLAWWYAGRNEALQARYAAGIEALVQQILGWMAPRWMDRRGRWF